MTCMICAIIIRRTPRAGDDEPGVFLPRVLHRRVRAKRPRVDAVALAAMRDHSIVDVATSLERLGSIAQYHTQHRTQFRTQHRT